MAYTKPGVNTRSNGNNIEELFQNMENALPIKVKVDKMETKRLH